MRAAPLSSRCVSLVMGALASGGGMGARAACEQRARGCGDVRLAHEAFADEEGVDAGAHADGRCRRAVKMPLSPMTMRSFGTRGARRSVVASVVSNVFRLRLLMPMSWQSSAARGRVRRRRGPRRWRPCPSPGAREARSRGAGVVDLGHDDEDAVGAPGARFYHLVGVDHEVLAQDRAADGGASAAVRYSGAPWKEGVSVRMERHAAPPAS